MQKKSFSILILVFIYLIFILDIIANQYFLYWYFWWFDMLMHFLGGFWVALLTYYIFFLSSYFKNISKKFSIFILSLVTVLVVGVLWEVFEYIMSVSTQQSNYILDTNLDLLMDILGWLIAYFFLLKIDGDKSVVAERVETDKIN